jgi:predicted permease
MLRLRQATLDSRVLAFALLLSLGAALLFGLAPSLYRLGAQALSGVHALGYRRTWTRQALITAQLSVSLILLTAASLLLMSLWRLQNAPLGFQRERIMTASFTLPDYRYPDDTRQLNFLNQLEARLNSLPGTVAAAITDSLPPGGETRTAPYVGPGENAEDPPTAGKVRWRYVTPGYFEALGIPIKRGRAFSETDRNPGEQPVVLSESLSRRYFGNGDPIGERIGGGWPRMVVGIAGDARNNGLANSSDPEFYAVRKISRDGIPGSGDPAWWRRATAIVRSTLTEQAAAASLRSTFRELDPTLPVKLETMDAQVEHFLTRPRFQTALLCLFALTGLVLAGIGLYGLISVLVAERTSEIGVRMALGATSSNVWRMVLSDAARWTGAGAIIGTAASLGLLRLFQGLLFEVKALDVRAFAFAMTALVAVALFAAWIPAHRASNIDPMIALRHE